MPSADGRAFPSRTEDYSLGVHPSQVRDTVLDLAGLRGKLPESWSPEVDIADLSFVTDSVADAFLHVVMGRDRRYERGWEFLQNPDRNIWVEGYRKLVASKGPQAKPRVAVTVERSDFGLKLLCGPCYVDELGIVAKAPEWRPGAWRSREDHGAAKLFEVTHAGMLFNDIDVPKSEIGQARLPVVCKAIVQAYWATVYRLRERFDVAVLSEVRLLRDERGAIAGLGIYDHLQAEYAALERELDDREFQRVTGYGPSTFWAVCQKHHEGKNGPNFARISSILRTLDGAAADLVPSAVRHWYGRLEKGRACHAWLPPPDSICPALADSVVPVKRLKGLPVYEPVRSAPAMTPPTYPTHRIRPLPEGLKEKLGVASSEELVAKVNELRMGASRPPITAFDYPTSGDKIARLAKTYLDALARYGKEAVGPLAKGP